MLLSLSGVPDLGSRSTKSPIRSIQLPVVVKTASKEAKALMAAAGHPNGVQGLDYLVRDVATFKLWAQAIQAMLAQIGVECKLRTVVESVWFDDTRNGNFDLAIGAIV